MRVRSTGFSLCLGCWLAVSLHAASLHDNFNSRQAFAYTAQIAGFGERWPGSPGHKKTEDLIHQVLQKDGARSRLTILRPRPRAAPSGAQHHRQIQCRHDPKQPILILAGHYDTLFQPGFIGANDGGSSTAILLAFADALGGKRRRCRSGWSGPILRRRSILHRR